MTYNQVIKETINFIETNIKEKISIEKLANNVGYSVFHFCRIFTLYQGVSPMDYIRKQRLTYARKELLNNNRIIDIALEYGFETSSGFSKAFYKEFGYSPTTYKKRMSVFSIKQIEKDFGGIIMNPILIKKPAFKVAGYGIKTNVTENYTKDIAAYWDKYNGENLESKMYKQLNPKNHGEVGVCIPCSEEKNAIYLFGVIVDDFSKVTSEMMTTVIPEAEYVVFTTPPVNSYDDSKTNGEDSLSIAVKETWKYILEEWFPKSNYKFDESKIDFEFYDERCHGCENLVMDIYVPIIKK